MELTVDPIRLADSQSGDPYVPAHTGIFVRAKHEGKWDGHDIAVLDRASLLEFLRKDGGDNIWAENVVGALLGHNGPIRKP